MGEKAKDELNKKIQGARIPSYIDISLESSIYSDHIDVETSMEMSVVDSSGRSETLEATHTSTITEDEFKDLFIKGSFDYYWKALGDQLKHTFLEEVENQKKITITKPQQKTTPYTGVSMSIPYIPYMNLTGAKIDRYIKSVWSKAPIQINSNKLKGAVSGKMSPLPKKSKK